MSILDLVHRPQRTVLFVSDNGHGLGHVTRLMAIARRLPPNVRPVLLTLSEAHGTVRDQGFVVEYFPSAGRLGLSKTRWTSLFTRRLDDVLRRFRPEVVVVDHVAPATAFLAARHAHPRIRFVWSRRGLWRPGANSSAEDTRAWFHEVLEPGDLAAEADAGFTATDRDGVVMVDPITLLDTRELLPRHEARAALGLPANGPGVLLGLSADEPDDLEGLIDRAVRAVRRVGPDAHLFAPRHPLHRDRLRDRPGVTMKAVYPVARYLRAFDVAIVAAGYNTSHEVVQAGVPGVFVPRATVSVDDQLMRAVVAERRGLGWYVPDLDDPRLDVALRAAFTGGGAEPERARANGADAAARFVAGLTERPGSVDPLPPPPTFDEPYRQEARVRLRSGRPDVAREAPRPVIDVVDLPDGDVAALAAQIGERQRDGEPLKPVLLVAASTDISPLARRRLAYETVLADDEVRWLELPDSPSSYRSRRRQEVAELFGASHVVVAAVGDDPDQVLDGEVEHRGSGQWAGVVSRLARSRSTSARRRR